MSDRFQFPSDLLSFATTVSSNFPWIVLPQVRKKRPDVFLEERVSLRFQVGVLPVRFVYGHAERCAVSGECSLRWSMLRALVLTPGQIRIRFSPFTES